MRPLNVPGSPQAVWLDSMGEEIDRKMMIETEIKIDTERERETEKKANNDEQISAPSGLYLSEVTLSLYTFHISWGTNCKVSLLCH